MGDEEVEGGPTQFLRLSTIYCNSPDLFGVFICLEGVSSPKESDFFSSVISSVSTLSVKSI